ncbi:unnamed protein product [Effrenium voratum]|nr:unnamed protein product [Effrenium voratum]
MQSMLNFAFAVAFFRVLAAEPTDQCEDEPHISHTGFLQQGISVKKRLCDRIEMPPEVPHSHRDQDGQDRSVYMLAVTNDSATNPHSYRYAERRNWRERWTSGGFISYWQSANSPEADWDSQDMSPTSQDPRTLKYNATLSVCGEMGCRSSMWHTGQWKGHRFYLYFCCWPDLVGNEVQWEGGQADSELVAYSWSLIQAQGGGMEKFPVVEVPSGPSMQSCPWRDE